MLAAIDCYPVPVGHSSKSAAAGLLQERQTRGFQPVVHGPPGVCGELPRGPRATPEKLETRHILTKQKTVLSSDSVAVFKLRLKTFIFSQAFSSFSAH